MNVCLLNYTAILVIKQCLKILLRDLKRHTFANFVQISLPDIQSNIFKREFHFFFLYFITKVVQSHNYLSQEMFLSVCLQLKLHNLEINQIFDNYGLLF